MEDIQPMEGIQEETSSESSGSDEDGESPEFVPSAWDKYATPTKSALRSPEKTLEKTDKVKSSLQKIICINFSLFRKNQKGCGSKNKNIIVYMSIPESQKVLCYTVMIFGNLNQITVVLTVRFCLHSLVPCLVFVLFFFS